MVERRSTKAPKFHEILLWLGEPYGDRRFRRLCTFNTPGTFSGRCLTSAVKTRSGWAHAASTTRMTRTTKQGPLLRTSPIGGLGTALTAILWTSDMRFVSLEPQVFREAAAVRRAIEMPQQSALQDSTGVGSRIGDRTPRTCLTSPPRLLMIVYTPRLTPGVAPRSESRSTLMAVTLSPSSP